MKQGYFRKKQRIHFFKQKKMIKQNKKLNGYFWLKVLNVETTFTLYSHMQILYIYILCLRNTLCCTEGIRTLARPTVVERSHNRSMSRTLTYVRSGDRERERERNTQKNIEKNRIRTKEIQELKEFELWSDLQQIYVEDTDVCQIR